MIAERDIDNVIGWLGCRACASGEKQTRTPNKEGQSVRNCARAHHTERAAVIAIEATVCESHVSF